jgi:hypothetical protein
MKHEYKLAQGASRHLQWLALLHCCGESVNAWVRSF